MGERTQQLLRDQLLRGRAQGHDPRVEWREPPPQYPNGVTKYWAVCSCGYRSSMRATHKQALTTIFWHLGKVLDRKKDHARNGVSQPGAVGPGL